MNDDVGVFVSGGVEQGRGHFFPPQLPPPLNPKQPPNLNRNTNHKTNGSDRRRNNGDTDEDDGEYGAEVWETLSKSFNQVQSVLDQNILLIQQAMRIITRRFRRI
ncbi:hypothetical protein Nepgr_000176 [Nepenthes gracilis]|uniref:Protein EARLY FLOWERING 4 domain-containing protein n=1 Tax=Nepenthes gracilis TaxID=150966 RepID=A0AAD3RVB9_NEPGR|nr:hypothetical protein Nepgr_000176 [Nepenthes gracilis]